MGNPVKPDTEPKKQTVIWKAEDWDRIERATQIIADREHIDIAPLDFIRGATMRRCDEVLGAA